MTALTPMTASAAAMTADFQPLGYLSLRPGRRLRLVDRRRHRQQSPHRLLDRRRQLSPGGQNRPGAGG